MSNINMFNLSIIYTNYEILSYYIQQNICDIINLNINTHRLFSYFFIFVSGLLTSINPCFLSLLPLSLSYLNIQNIEQKNKFFFTFGIFSSFICFISLSHIISYRYYFVLSSIPIISSIIIIVLGLNFLQIIDFYQLFPFISYNSISYIQHWNIPRDYLWGVIFSLTTLPCSTPIIFTILFWLSHASNIFLSISYLFIYLIGSFISIFILINGIYTSIRSSLLFKFWNFLLPSSGFIVLFNGIISLLKIAYG